MLLLRGLRLPFSVLFRKAETDRGPLQALTQVVNRDVSTQNYRPDVSLHSKETSRYVCPSLVPAPSTKGIRFS